MQKIRKLLIIFLLVSVTSQAQNSEIFTNYINTYKDIAIKEMQRSGVPASITLAQGILESGAGTSELVLASNNHFGIKCKSSWKGESVKHDDDYPNECFRKYPAAMDSYRDHSDFLRSNQRYASLFTLEPADYVGWAKGLKNAGYATEPNYSEALIKLIEDYHLQDYTMIALGKMPVDVQIPVKESDKTPVETKSLNPNLNSEQLKSVEKLAKPSAYPDGEFKINGTKAVFVKKGTPFLVIAKQYDIDLSKIFEFNEIQQAEEANKDQLVYLQRKRKTGDNAFHIVKPGETLHDIAQLEAIRLESLIELNWLKAGMQPAIGEQLSLKGKSHSTPKLALRENYSIVPATKNKSTE